ncbi:CrcB protein [Microbacterium sp. SORGH_AS428]|uniref:fluoride efflux transporter FluC n=1 Tax=Microbacterium sp. SORGH_AS_0428 TaxID=3041788 RepID=UPI00285B79B3|nr:CrcB family protein [Microbacterium sp. SORGH_AS_0428]MDR6200114.1 CrcB protein [Microbacterium sp. SORGH_AS_0428]
MTPLVFLVVAVAGGVGAGARYVVDLAVSTLVGARFPWGTLVINVTGSFALGLLTGAVSDAALLAVIGTGLLGGFTTFSSVAAVSAVMATDRRGWAAATNTVGTLVLAIAAAAVGLAVGGLVAG